MTIHKAISELVAEYELAKARGWVIDPVAYALYAVWKQADADHKRKESKR